VVWDSNSGNTLKVISGFHRRCVFCFLVKLVRTFGWIVLIERSVLSRGVNLLAFSDSGRYLASVGLDDDHSIAIYNLEKETLVAKEKVDRAKTLGLAFGSDSDIVAVGVGFIKFFTLNEKTGELKSKKGTLPSPKSIVVSVSFLNSDVLTGRTIRTALLVAQRAR
jgi:WD40 repeat protein